MWQANQWLAAMLDNGSRDSRFRRRLQCQFNGSTRLTAKWMHGPCTSLEMKHLASTGQILPTYRVQRKGRDKTVMARNVKGLFRQDAK